MGRVRRSVILKQMTRRDELWVKDAVLKDPLLVSSHYNWNRQLKLTQTTSQILNTFTYLRIFRTDYDV